MFLEKPLVLVFESVNLPELLLVEVDHGIVVLQPRNAILHTLVLNAHTLLKNRVLPQQFEDQLLFFSEELTLNLL